MVKACRQLGVEYLTLFAFSSENWRRPADEVSFLMQLFLKMLEREVGKLHENNIRLKVIGDRNRFDAQLVRYIEEAEQLTSGNTSLTLTIAANYGGRWDIMQAMHALNQAHPERARAFDEEELQPYLSMHYAPSRTCSSSFFPISGLRHRPQQSRAPDANAIPQPLAVPLLPHPQ